MNSKILIVIFAIIIIVICCCLISSSISFLALFTANTPEVTNPLIIVPGKDTEEELISIGKPDAVRYAGTDVPGFDYNLKQVNNENECLQACISDNGCYWYDYNNGNCLMKQPVTMTSVNTGIKVPGFPYTIYENKDITGFDIPGAGATKVTEKQCQNLCDSMKNCYWYNYVHDQQRCAPKTPLVNKSINTSFIIR